MKQIFIVLSLMFLFVNNAFCDGPFGISFGMTLEQIRKISKTKPQNVENDGWYVITPPNTHRLFEKYLIQIHPTHGVYHIAAVSRTITTTGHGTELISQFDNIVSMLEKTYGNYLKRNHLNPESTLNRSQYFMYTLKRGDRELKAFWDREKGSRMPDNMARIVLSAEATEFGENGFLALGYSSIYADKIDEEDASAF